MSAKNDYPYTDIESGLAHTAHAVEDGAEQHNCTACAVRVERHTQCQSRGKRIGKAVLVIGAIVLAGMYFKGHYCHRHKGHHGKPSTPSKPSSPSSPEASGDPTKIVPQSAVHSSNTLMAIAKEPLRDGEIGQGKYCKDATIPYTGNTGYSFKVPASAADGAASFNLTIQGIVESDIAFKYRDDAEPVWTVTSELFVNDESLLGDVSVDAGIQERDNDINSHKYVLHLDTERRKDDKRCAYSNIVVTIPRDIDTYEKLHAGFIIGELDHTPLSSLKFNKVSLGAVVSTFENLRLSATQGSIGLVKGQIGGSISNANTASIGVVEGSVDVRVELQSSAKSEDEDDEGKKTKNNIAIGAVSGDIDLAVVHDGVSKFTTATMSGRTTVSGTGDIAFKTKSSHFNIGRRAADGSELTAEEDTSITASAVSGSVNINYI